MRRAAHPQTLHRLTLEKKLPFSGRQPALGGVAERNAEAQMAGMSKLIWSRPFAHKQQRYGQRLSA
jgi:hypothetical protein